MFIKKEYFDWKLCYLQRYINKNLNLKFTKKLIKNNIKCQQTRSFFSLPLHFVQQLLLPFRFLLVMFVRSGCWRRGRFPYFPTCKLREPSFLPLSKGLCVLPDRPLSSDLSHLAVAILVHRAPVATFPAFPRFLVQPFFFKDFVSYFGDFLEAFGGRRAQIGIVLGQLQN